MSFLCVSLYVCAECVCVRCSRARGNRTQVVAWQPVTLLTELSQWPRYLSWGNSAFRGAKAEHCGVGGKGWQALQNWGFHGTALRENWEMFNAELEDSSHIVDIGDYKGAPSRFSTRCPRPLFTYVREDRDRKAGGFSCLFRRSTTIIRLFSKYCLRCLTCGVEVRDQRH